MSHDPSEIILICLFAAQEAFSIIVYSKHLHYTINKLSCYAKKFRTLKYSSKHKQPEFSETSITLDQLVISSINAFSLLKNKTGRGEGEFFQGPKAFTWTLKQCWKKKRKIGSWSIPFIKGLNCYITEQKHSISYRNRGFKKDCKFIKLQRGEESFRQAEMKMKNDHNATCTVPQG